jgi:hypothetical protein
VLPLAARLSSTPPTRSREAAPLKYAARSETRCELGHTPLTFFGWVRGYLLHVTARSKNSFASLKQVPSPALLRRTSTGALQKIALTQVPSAREVTPGSSAERRAA